MNANRALKALSTTLFLALAAVLLTHPAWAQGGQGAPAAPPPANIDISKAPSKGKKDAQLTLVEFADYQCPYCVRATDVVKQVLEKYPDDVRFVYKQFPLVSIHKFAEPASRASIAAGRQGKFWEMHDVLFQNSRALDDASLKKYAGDIGLDVAKFEKDFADPAVAAEVQAEMAEAQKLGVGGTPTFYLNGYNVPSWDFQTLSSLIDGAKVGKDVGAAIAEATAAMRERQMAAQKAEAERRAQLANQVFDIDVTGSPVKGDAGAKVTIVEFGDFQCPFCANSQPLIKQVLDAYPGKVKFVHKNLPLVQIHPNARPAAIASQAALEQGKFWEMHELLYQNYNKLSAETIKGLAQQVGLDMAKFEASITSDKASAAVEKDIADSRRYMVSGTPTYFINGKRVMQRDFQTFQRMIDEALNAKAPSAS